MFRIETDSWRMKCYSFEESEYDKEVKSNANNASPICLLEYADRTIVLTGDAEVEVESYAIAKGYLNNIDADILKVGHHGSTTSTSQAFLDRIDCEYAIVSVGEDNKYGHPEQILVDRLEDYKDIKADNDFNGFAEVYYTDDDGTVTVQIDEKGVMKINTEDSPEKDVTVGGVFQEEEIVSSGEVAMAYYKDEKYFCVA